MACFLAFWPRHPGSLLMLMIQIPYKSNGVFRLYLIQTSSVHCNRLQIVLKGHRCEPVAPCTQLYEVEARANVVDVPKTWEKSFTMGGIDFMHTFIYIYMHTPEKIMFQKFINMRLNQTFVQETDQQHRKDTSKHAVLHSYQSGQPVGSKRSLVGSIRCMAAVRAGRVDSNAGGSWAINQLEFSWVTFTGLKKTKSNKLHSNISRILLPFFRNPRCMSSMDVHPLQHPKVVAIIGFWDSKCFLHDVT